MPPALLERRRWYKKRSSTARPRMGTFMPGLQREDLVGGTAEHLREGQGQQEARHVTVALDRVDALSRDADRVGEVLLGPALLGAEFFDSVPNGGRHVKLACHDGPGPIRSQANLSWLRGSSKAGPPGTVRAAKRGGSR